MSESENPVLPKKPVSQGLAGVDIDPSKMSPKTLEIYKDYRAIVEEDVPISEKILRDAEHRLRNAINADKMAEAEKKASESPQNKK